MPLYRLTQFNIEEAISLGLLDMTAARVSKADLFADLEKSWESTARDLQGYHLVIGQMMDRCAEGTTWLQPPTTATGKLVIHRVSTASTLRFPLEKTVGAARKRIETPIKRLKQLIDEMEKNRVNPTGNLNREFEQQLRLICEDLRDHLCRLPPSRPPVQVLASGLHSETSRAWITYETGQSLDRVSSQDIRDSLGLVHYPDRKKPKCVSQSLVMMSFEVTLAKTRLPVSFDPAFISTNPDGLWLVRPTVCHGPNERFVQRHTADLAGNPTPYGRTINLCNANYEEGFPELILLHGDRAKLVWQDVRLLTPPPVARGIDDDHAGFLDAILRRSMPKT